MSAGAAIVLWIFSVVAIGDAVADRPSGVWGPLACAAAVGISIFAWMSLNMQGKAGQLVVLREAFPDGRVFLGSLVTGSKSVLRKTAQLDSHVGLGGICFAVFHDDRLEMWGLEHRILRRATAIPRGRLVDVSDVTDRSISLGIESPTSGERFVFSLNLFGPRAWRIVGSRADALDFARGWIPSHVSFRQYVLPKKA